MGSSKRCPICKKKLGLTAITCRCGNTYCTGHRHAESHNCTFDYKEEGRNQLSKVITKCETAKLEKI